jgi:hypothetical protein
MCKLEVHFQRYERYAEGRRGSATIEREDLLACLKVLVDHIDVYLDVDDIEEDNMTTKDIIEHLNSVNGDGCDFIYRLAEITNPAEPIVHIDNDLFTETKEW